MDKNKLHEEFVSGGVGDKPWVVPIQGLCGGILMLMNYHIIRIFKLKLSGFPQLMFNFFIVIFPYTLLMTVLSSYLLEIFIVLSSIVICIQLSHSWKGSNVERSIGKSFYYSEFDCLRTCVLVPTAIAILAVDFKIFPRSWVKTEYFGYSVMDVGTSGSFMLMGIGDEILNEKNKTKGEVKVEKKFLKKLPSWLVLFVLGVIRMVFMIIFNYHSHVSEYGVHWNFFITMGCVALLSKAFAKYIGMKMLFLCLGLNYTILNLFGFQEWGLDNDASRTNIISANKEGIISLLGYFSIYILYRIIGRYLLLIKKSGQGRYLSVTLETLIAPVIFFSLQLLSEHYLGEPSRRVFNIPFFFYTAGTTSLWFSLMVYAEKSTEELRNARKYKDLLYLLSKMSNLYKDDDPFDIEANAKKQLYSMRKSVSSAIGQIHNQQKVKKQGNTLYCDVKGDELIKLEEDSFVPGSFRSSRDDKERKAQEKEKSSLLPVNENKQKVQFLGNVYFAETTDERKEKWLNILEQRRVNNV